jgi:hypothetical protein
MDDVPPEFRCRCSAWSLQCHHRATQEDMRCDPCREGCVLVAVGPPDAPEFWMHLKMVEWEKAFSGPPVVLP